MPLKPAAAAAGPGYNDPVPTGVYRKETQFFGRSCNDSRIRQGPGGLLNREAHKSVAKVMDMVPVFSQQPAQEGGKCGVKCRSLPGNAPSQHSPAVPRQ